MTRPTAPDPYLDAKLLGILLSGVFGQTRPDCSRDGRSQPERPSGVHPIPLPKREREPDR
jgi:hypothetical protein